jgi:4-hydroxyphenylpyruvate dioxygenase
LRSGLYSQVLIHPQSGLRLPINEPSSAQSQIQEFLDLHGGSGIQHVALQTAPITATITLLQQRGINFLAVPKGYYDQIKKEFTAEHLSDQEWQILQKLQILVDVEKAPDHLINSPEKLPFLLQIFTHPIFSQPTFFFEFIERRSQAQGFGEGNFQALFEAIEREQLKRVS